MPLTANGAPFSWLLFPYSEQFAKNACQITIGVECAWDAAADVKAYLCGFSEWDGSSATLTRTLPYKCPVADYLYCEALESMEFGWITADGLSNDPALDDWPNGKWCKYKALFTRPPYKLLEDDRLSASSPYSARSGKEYERYVSIRRRANPRERRRPSYVFVRVDTGDPVDEVGFLPDVSTSYWVTWHQVPADAVPEGAINKAGAHVNDAAIKILDQSGRVVIDAGAEQLLFKGCEQPIEPYGGADGGLYVDLTYVMELRKSSADGWQGYQLNAGGFTRLKVKGTGSTPPYPTYDFSKLFTPGSTG